jgi:hypothetical protein
VFDLQQIDLSSLIAGNSFTLACTLRTDGNGIAVQVEALGDTGASGYVFINLEFATDLCRSLGVKPKRLLYTIYPKGFNSQKGSFISQYLLLNIEINSCRIPYIPMLIIELDSHDIIIGQNFFDYFHILIDVYDRRL